MSFALLVYSGVRWQVHFQRSTERSSRYAHSDTAQVSRAVEAGRMWLVEKIEINGGFLPGLNVNIPPGLTCIIGPRGSEKSTLAEALRFAVCGTSGAPKGSVDLIQANLAGGALVTITAKAEEEYSDSRDKLRQ